MTRIISCAKSVVLGPNAPYLWFLVLVGVLAHRDWFLSTNPIAVGDWAYLWPQWMQGFAGPPISWVSEANLGYYNLNASLYWIQGSMGALSLLGVGFNLSERLFFFWPAGLLPGLTMFFFCRSHTGRIPATVAGLVYELNTAGLFLGGAHLTHAMAYAVAPLALLFLRIAVERNSTRGALSFGLAFALIIAYEPRYAYIVAGVALGYLVLLSLKHPPVITKRRSLLVAAMAGIPAAVNAYWLVPAALFPSQVFSGIPAQLLAPTITLPYSLALYNPYWSTPLASFQIQPIPWYAFLLPLLAFLPLLSRRLDAEILFFALVAICGIFLAKQNTPPLADLYPWFFAHVPGFSVFRESSKFFVLTALGYAVLLGDLTARVWRRVSTLRVRRQSARGRLRLQPVFALGAVALVAIAAVAPSQGAFTNSLGDAFTTTSVPPLYTNLSRLLDDGGFSRSLWFLTTPLFGFHSNEHPAVNATSFLVQYGTGLASFADQEDLLNCLSIKYVIETPDAVYAGDSSFDFVRSWYSNVTAVASLQPVPGFPGTQVWRNPTALPLIYGIDLPPQQAANDSAVLSAPKVSIPFRSVGVDTYQVTLPTPAPKLVVLSQAYDGNWVGDVGNREVSVFPLMHMLNAFDTGGANGTTLTITYRAQPIFEAGALLSVAVIATSMVFIVSPTPPWEWFRRKLPEARRGS